MVCLLDAGNPTSVECFDLAQSNSEHSRHWFFKGRLTVDGRPLEGSLMDMIAATQATSRDNNVIRFSDNSSAIRGFSFDAVVPSKSVETSASIHSDSVSRYGSVSNGH